MPAYTGCSLKKKRRHLPEDFCYRTLIFAQNLTTGMASGTFKSLLVATLSVFILLFCNTSFGQTGPQPVGASKEASPKGTFNAGEEILGHVKDAYEFHFFTAGNYRAVLHLPVILYTPRRGGWAFFSSAHLDEEQVYQGYQLKEGKIIAVKDDGTPDTGVTVYDLSMTRNVAQMLLVLIVLVWIMTGVGKKYIRNGYKTAPSGFQGLLEPLILFIRDEVAVPNLGTNALKYMPYLLTVFFFILLNVLFGLAPGSANVVGNIGFTMVLALIAFVVILFSSNRHYWGHMIWPPGVPFLVKLILIPIEIVSNLIVKPAALMIRLFANMIAGHIVILSFVALIFIFGQISTTIGWSVSPISILFCVFIYMIELLVAFIQSFIFTTLTATFISQACEGDHAHGGHDDPVII
jgi:F-type H+-transporting ATPase subunit a